MSLDVVNGPGVYVTEQGACPILIFNDHEVVFTTADYQYAWTRDGKPNNPETRRDHGAVRAKLFDLVDAVPGVEPVLPTSTELVGYKGPVAGSFGGYLAPNGDVVSFTDHPKKST